MTNQYNFSEAELNEINDITNNGTENFYQAYDYVHGLIKDDVNVDNNTKVWFERAVQINSNDPEAAANIFIRSVTSFGFQWDDKAVIDMQIISEDIGKEVVGALRDFGGVPDLSTLVVSDINAAIEKHGQTLGGWGGSFYYWDLDFKDGKTVGESILSDPDDLEKFIAVNAAALKSTLSSEFGQEEEKRELYDAFKFGFASSLPISLKFEIIERAIYTTKEGSYAGSPDYIMEWTFTGDKWVRANPFLTSAGIEEASEAEAEFLDAERLKRLENYERGRFEEVSFSEDKGVILGDGLNGAQVIVIKDSAENEVINITPTPVTLAQSTSQSLGIPVHQLTDIPANGAYLPGGSKFFADDHGNTYTILQDGDVIALPADVDTDIAADRLLQYVDYDPEADNPYVTINPASGSLKSKDPLNSFKEYIDNGGDQQSFFDAVGQGIVDWLDDTNNVWLVYNKNHIC